MNPDLELISKLQKENENLRILLQQPKGWITELRDWRNDFWCEEVDRAISGKSTN